MARQPTVEVASWPQEKLASMRILQVLPRYAPAWAYGGGVHMFWMLARELVRRGHKLEVVTSDSLSRDTRSERLEEELDEGIHVRRYRNRYNSMSATLPAVFYRPKAMRDGLRAAVAGADVVHMGESRGIHNVWTAEATSRAGIPLAWSAFGGLPTATGIRGLYRHAHDLMWTRQVVPRVDAFIAQTTHERSVYREHGAADGKIREIPLCVDLSAFADLPARGGFRRRIGLSNDAELILCVARLAPVKGLELLVEAHAKIPPDAGGPHLALVGWDHGSLAALRSLAARLGTADRVHFPGALFGDDRLLAYRDADVFALAPSVFEETSLAALEAAASGCPTVLTPQCEVPGLADVGGGYVVERDASSVARAVARLLGDDELRGLTSKNARAHVQRNFSVEHVTDLHESLFRELAG